MPDIFRESQGVVATGRLGPGHTFVAGEVLARHDENHVPSKVAVPLEKARRMPNTSVIFVTTTFADP